MLSKQHKLSKSDIAMLNEHFAAHDFLQRKQIKELGKKVDSYKTIVTDKDLVCIKQEHKISKLKDKVATGSDLAASLTAQVEDLQTLRHETNNQFLQAQS